MAKVSTTTLKKNLERNIETFDEGVTDRSRQSDAIITRTVMILFAILFPLCIVCFSANFVFRIPDIYSFDLGRTLSAKEADIDMENKDLAEAISEYMFHSKSLQSLNKSVTKTDGKSAFEKKDLNTLTAYRKSLDKGFLVFCIALVLSVALYAFMLHTKRKRTLRRSFLFSFVGFLFWMVLFVSLLFPAKIRMQIFAGGVVSPANKATMLSTLFDTKLFWEMGAVMVAISLLILFTANSVTRAITKETEIF
ncbi:MAG: DUF1461 domain-containing protein [Clostridiales Family XIII bacterium]|jgi:hypothetical protein|nr:DUF1461 domain-containing protein [Clostridiales Family XIII bacterium]